MKLGYAAAAIALPAIAFAQATPCGCNDVADLINRLDMAHAAIDKYRSELANAGKPDGMGSKTVDGAAANGNGNYLVVLHDSLCDVM
jgi:hypothetical protein